MKDLGIRLKTYREKYGYSQNQLAEKLHVSRQAISKWETDKARPDLEILKTLSALYDISIDEILGNTKSDAKQESEKNSNTIQDDTVPNQPAKQRVDTLENIIILVLAILSCSIPVLGIIIVVWILKNKRDSKIMTLIGIFCIVVNLYNTFIFINNMFLKVGYQTVQSLS